MKKIIFLINIMSISLLLMGMGAGIDADHELANRIITQLDEFQRNAGPNPGVPRVQRVQNELESDDETTTFNTGPTSRRVFCGQKSCPTEIKENRRTQ